MKYFKEDEFNPSFTLEQMKVFFDDESDSKINSDGVAKIMDTEGVAYVNLDLVEEDQQMYISDALCGIDSLIGEEMEDDEKTYTAWNNTVEALRESTRDSKIYPFVDLQEFTDRLADEIGEQSVRQLEEDLGYDFDDFGYEINDGFDENGYPLDLEEDYSERYIEEDDEYPYAPGEDPYEED